MSAGPDRYGCRPRADGRVNTEIARSHRHGDGRDPFGLGTCLNPAGMGGTSLARLAGVEGSHCVSSCWTYLGQIIVMRTGRYVEVFTQMVVATPPAVPVSLTALTPSTLPVPVSVSQPQDSAVRGTRGT
jgi:hypothetical protein